MVKKSKSSFIKVSQAQTKSAFGALKQLLESQRDPKDLLFNENEFLTIQVEVNKIPELGTLRCVGIPLPHSLYSRKCNSQVFLIVKDPQREWKEKLDTLNLKDTPLAKVMGISKFGKNFTQFKDRRSLVSEYDLFLSDIRVFNMLPDRLGKYFYLRKKIPALINLEEDPEASIKQAINSTYLVASKGPIFNIKVARATMKPKEVVENVQAVLEALPTVLPGLEPQHIRRVDLKFPDTLSLPVYNYLTTSEVSAYKN